jgi:hypothetical protein
VAVRGAVAAGADEEVLVAGAIHPLCCMARGGVL